MLVIFHCIRKGAISNFKSETTVLEIFKKIAVNFPLLYDSTDLNKIFYEAFVMLFFNFLDFFYIAKMDYILSILIVWC